MYLLAFTQAIEQCNFKQADITFMTFFFRLMIWVSDQIPYIEAGTYVAYNNENGGVIDRMKQDGILDLDTELQSLPEWISMKAVVTSWLDEALMYELWIGCDGTSARKIYYSDLSWPIGKILFLKQTYILKQRLGITKENAEQREEQVLLLCWSLYYVLSSLASLIHC